MAPYESNDETFTILPIRMPAMPSYPHEAVHEVRFRRNVQSIPTPEDSRSLFLKNIPVDSTIDHFRALFFSLIGAGRFETITFADETPDALVLDPAQAIKMSSFARKRKRSDLEAAERVEQQAAELPKIWSRTIQRSGSTAVALLADEKSVRLVISAIKKLHKTKKYPVWGAGLDESIAPLGGAWISSHLQACRADKSETQRSAHAFFDVFNRKEKEAIELSKRLRNEPDEDGFVTVTRGGRTAPASRTEADEARRNMMEKQFKKRSETQDFYRFQHRERRKEEQAALLRRFENDRKRVDAMRLQRGKPKPEV